MKILKQLGTMLATVAFVVMLSMTPSKAATMESELSTKMLKPAETSAVVTSKEYQGTIGSDNTGIVVPIKVSGSGEAFVDVKVESSVSGIHVQSIKVDKYTQDFVTSSTTGNVTTTGSITGTGIHHLCIDAKKSDKNDDLGKTIKVIVKAYEYPKAANQTIKANTYVEAFMDNLTPIYYTVSIPSEGYIAFNEKAGDARVDLYNNKGKAIVKNSDDKAKTVVYGVKKGTYKVKVENSGYSNLRYVFTKCATNKNTKKSKAYTLKRSKTAKSTIILGSKSRTRWYKIKVTKNRKVTATLSKLKNKDMTYGVKVYKGSKKVNSKFKIAKGKIASKKKLAKGTYYIALTAETKPDCSVFSLKWK